MSDSPVFGVPLIIALVLLLAVAVGASRIGRLGLAGSLSSAAARACVQLAAAAETCVVEASRRLIAAGRILPRDLRDALPSR